MTERDTTDFGFSSIPLRDKTEKVQRLFESVANHYDLMNDLMSLGVHRLWKRNFVKDLPMKANQSILDVAGGTGDIALGIMAHFPYLQPKVTVCDLTPPMIEHGRNKAVDQGVLSIQWACGNGETLPFADNTFDGYTIAFGLRNVCQKEKALSEAVRVLKPEGWFRCLEFSHPQHETFGKIYDAYSFSVLPRLGQFVAHDGDAYKYLIESIRTFPTQQVLCDMMGHAGLTGVSYQNMWNGLVAVHKGQKPRA
jgi:demethylmenaquinone methyltransferase/2-methoxy-6-polyprenyl-1,4-benzoquinol methylase